MKNRIEEISKNLIESQIVDFKINATDLSVKITFLIEEKNKYTLLLNNVLILKYSRSLDDESPYQIYECSINEVLDGGKDLFEKLDYGFSQIDNSANKFIYQDKRLFHIFLEGDICIDVVCADIKLI